MDATPRPSSPTAYKASSPSAGAGGVSYSTTVLGAVSGKNVVTLPDKVAALEGAIDELRTLLRDRDAKLKRQEDELRYRSRRVLDLERALQSAQVSVASPASPSGVQVMQRGGGNGALNLTARSAVSRSPSVISSFSATAPVVSPAPAPKPPSLSLVTSALHKLKTAMKPSPRSRSVEASPRSVSVPSPRQLVAPVSTAAPMHERMADAEARAQAHVLLLRERDATIAKLQEDLKYRARKMTDQGSEITALKSKVKGLEDTILQLQRTLRA